MMLTNALSDPFILSRIQWMRVERYRLTPFDSHRCAPRLRIKRKMGVSA